MKPKYSAGEKVLLRSIDYARFNDVYHVSKVLSPKSDQVCDLTGTPYWNDNDNIGYVLEELKELDEQDLEYSWSESALRKLHDPSGDSFEEMMGKLNKANVEEFV